MRTKSLLLLVIASSFSLPHVVFGHTQSPEKSNTDSSAVQPVTDLKGVKAPHVIFAPDPDYSQEARRKEIQGTCVLWLIVDQEGKPRDIKVVRGLGYGLDQKAIETAQRWRFDPALRNGKPVPVQINVEMSFRMYGGQPPVDIPKLMKRAEAGNAKAEMALAEAYFRGSGVGQSDSEGYRLLKAAADQNLREAQFEMGEHLFAHASSPEDYIAAYMWFTIARGNRYKHGEQIQTY